MTRKTFTLLGCLVALSSGLAFAEEGDEELVEKVAVRNRLFTPGKHFELGANIGFTLLPRLTEHYVLNLQVAYNIVDWFAIEARGGYAFGGLTSLGRQVQDGFADGTTGDDAQDLWQMTGHGVLGVRFQPIYGKVNLIGEGSLHFQMYLGVYGGVTGLKKESLVLCPEGKSTCNDWIANDRQGASPFTLSSDASQTYSKVSPLVSLALGFRFLFGREAHHSAMLEARSWSWLDSYLTGINKASVSAANPTGGGTVQSGGITTLMTVSLGYAYIF